MSNASLRAQAADLILAISRQQRLLEDMQAQLEDLKRRLDSIVYPVLTLPPEISSEIFLYCIPSTRPLDVVNIDEAPLLLMRICSAWRQIAVSTPALWSTFKIDADYIRPHFSEIVGTWLSRARLCPLSVTITGPLFGIRHFDSLLESLRRHSGVMRSLELNMVIGDLTEMATHPMSFPMLQKLAIGFRDGVLSDSTCVKMFDYVPMLHELLLHYALPSFITLPWQQLTKFTAEWYSLAECLEALQLMPNIVESRLVGVLLAEDNGVPLDSISHPKIQYFALVDSNTEILNFLTLPGLQTLEILDFGNGFSGFDSEAFGDFLSRSAPSLRKIVIQSDHAIDLRLISLSALPALVDLEIWHPPTAFVAALFDLPGLKHVQRLSLLSCREATDEASIFDVIELASGMIPHRRTTWPDLRSFRFVAASERYLPIFSDEMLLPFRKLKEEGIDVYIGTETESFV
ncbi:hypothetical protein B0H17DRAFT_481438 [Mycena rosella]|uniref:F-box domain-containing protein n=1 Tax=Mycena rosella TaxID=1033263 RepID=A0AAD7DLZ4_MYCRO|nr:hypothetical protein B0H17DRAFT_481438 [Mycena rosella]